MKIKCHKFGEMEFSPNIIVIFAIKTINERFLFFPYLIHVQYRHAFLMNINYITYLHINIFI